MRKRMRLTNVAALRVGGRILRRGMPSRTLKFAIEIEAGVCGRISHATLAAKSRQCEIERAPAISFCQRLVNMLLSFKSAPMLIDGPMCPAKLLHKALALQRASHGVEVAYFAAKAQK